MEREQENSTIFSKEKTIEQMVKFLEQTGAKEITNIIDKGRFTRVDYR